MVRIVVCMIFVSLFFSCKKDKVNHGNRIPLAEYKENWLYLDDVEDQLSPAMTEQDSTRVIEYAIKDWIGDIQIEELAIRNIRSMERIDGLIQKYRRQLLLHEYKEQLAEERISKQINDRAISDFYEANKDQLLAVEPLVLGVALRVPIGAEQISQVRDWMKKCDENSIEKIEKYSIKNAISYNYFRNNWQTLNDVLDGTGLRPSLLLNGITDKKSFEFSDSTSIIFIKIDEYCPTGKPMPIDYARNQIAELFINEQTSEYLSTYRKEMFEKALESERINFVSPLSLRVKELLINNDSTKTNNK